MSSRKSATKVKTQAKSEGISEPVQKKSVKTKSQPIIEEPHQEEVVEDLPCEEEPQQSARQVLDARVENILKMVSDIVVAVKALQQECKPLPGNINKSEKEKEKEKRKRKVNTKSTNNQNSKNIFAMKYLVSDALNKFLGSSSDTLYYRKEVTSKVWEYIKEKKLKSDKGGVITPDAKLKSILGDPRFPMKKKNPERGIGYSSANLQCYLASHYVKSVEVSD
ncbi:MAG TPA: SWIB/MDM2 domain-containing protein [Allocoleopsis sp.]